MMTETDAPEREPETKTPEVKANDQTPTNSSEKVSELITERMISEEESISPYINYELGDLDFVETPEMTSASDSREELEMVRATLPDPKVDAGEGLIVNLESIPGKMAFKIGEAAELVGVKQYVLRYWETEFEMLRPRKSKNNQRVYSRRDVETAMMIKKLLYEDRFSIEGARSALKQLKSQVKEEKSIKAMARSQDMAVNKLRGLVTEIRRIREIFN